LVDNRTKKKKKNRSRIGGAKTGVGAEGAQQEAQLPQRNSASAAHMEGGWG